MAASSAAAGLLSRQLKQMQNDKSISGISCGLCESNVFEWEVMLMIDDDTKYYGGGFFRARLTFPVEYPLLPPKMRFETPIFHPNSMYTPVKQALEAISLHDICTLYPFLDAACFDPTSVHIPSAKAAYATRLTLCPVYPNGDVCISILHPPGEDKYGYENADERWSPVQTPETILLSVISMLSTPNDESPANVEAAALWRDDVKEFKKRVRKCVRESLEE